MSLISRWIELVYKTATGSWKVRAVLAPLLGAGYLSLIAFFVFLSFALDRRLGLPDPFPPAVSFVIGLFLMGSGLFLMLFAIAYFVKVRGTPVPLSPPPKLVTTGPYGFSRNPMLTGVFMQLFGLGIAFGSLSLLVIFTPLFIVLNVWELKSIEEPELEKRLGQDYVEYRKRVPMFFPCLRKRHRGSR